MALPGGIVSSMEQATISTWVYLFPTRLGLDLDFGSGTNVNMFLTPAAAGSPALRFAITTSSWG